jgi:uncharacterized protein
MLGTSVQCAQRHGRIRGLRYENAEQFSQGWLEPHQRPAKGATALHLVHEIGHALYMAFAMFWEILWALILGFFISGVVQAVVSKYKIAEVLGDSKPKTIAAACGLGAASSSCSYAAVAIARALFHKGANFTAAMAFELGSTNLVAELGIIMAILLGWQFTLAEFIGAPLMVAIMAVLFRLFLKPEMIRQAREQANKGIRGSMEGHAEMDMAASEGPLLRRMLSDKGRTAISHYFVMDWVSIWKDIAGGLLFAGILAVFVPKEGWQAFFLTSHPKLTTFWSPLVGPVVAVLSFVCSVGNVPLAAVLWNGGSSFGGVLAFIYADLIVAADPEHLPQVLRPANQHVSAGHNVRFNGLCRAHHRAVFQSGGTGSGRAACADC